IAQIRGQAAPSSFLTEMVSRGSEPSCSGVKVLSTSLFNAGFSGASASRGDLVDDLLIMMPSSVSSFETSSLCYSSLPIQIPAQQKSQAVTAGVVIVTQNAGKSCPIRFFGEPAKIGDRHSDKTLNRYPRLLRRLINPPGELRIFHL